MKCESQQRPTQRAMDRWDSSPFSSIFLASSLYCSQAVSTRAHLYPEGAYPQGATQTQAVGRLRSRQNPRFKGAVAVLGGSFYGCTL